MKIGILKETNRHEDRVVLRPLEVKKIIKQGHSVFVEQGAGVGVHFLDEAYLDAGAEIKATDQIYTDSEMLLKLRCPTDDEFKKINDKILFCMLHTGQNPKRVEFIKQNKIIAIEMESVTNPANERYVDATDLTGEAGVIYACQFLKKVPKDLKVLVLGYGRVGSAAIDICNKLNMDVKILRKAEFSSIKHFLKGKDMIINGIAWPEEEMKKKRYLITREMLKLLNHDAAILDLSVDYPNPIETCRPTTLTEPTFVLDGVTHISIYGYPGLVPVSSVNKYSEQILPLVLEMANNGIDGLDSNLGKDLLNAMIR